MPSWARFALGLTERQRTALIDAAALTISVGAPLTAHHLLTAAGIEWHDARALVRTLCGFTSTDWTLVRLPEQPRDVVVDDRRQAITVDAERPYGVVLDRAQQLLADALAVTACPRTTSRPQRGTT